MYNIGVPQMVAQENICTGYLLYGNGIDWLSLFVKNIYMAIKNSLVAKANKE